VNFFIQRPIFAMSIALVMILAGAICMLVLSWNLLWAMLPKR
jgi:multidrug efflux pump subunit AcrB